MDDYIKRQVEEIKRDEKISLKKDLEDFRVKPSGVELIRFETNAGFEIRYDEKGTMNCKEDKYHIYWVSKKKRRYLCALREDECILLSALLNFSVHKKLVEIDGVGINEELVSVA